MDLAPPPVRLTCIANAADAARLMRAGQLVAHPTESLLGIAADPLSDRALDRLDVLKARTTERGYVLAAAHLDHGAGWLGEAPLARRLLGTRWSGPLTVVAPAGPAAPDRVRGPGGTIAIRIDPHPAARQLGEALGHPWVSTSLNLPGQPPAQAWDEVPAALADALAGVLHVQPAPRGTGSTLVRAVDGDLQILRAGEVSLDELRAGLTGPEASDA